MPIPIVDQFMHKDQCFLMGATCIMHENV